MIDVNEIIQQARAEVLAACVHHVRRRAAQLDNITANILADELLVELQPTAKDLEELLRQEREKGHMEGHKCDDLIIEIDEDGEVKGCSYKIDALRKEKARASEGKG